MGAEKVYTEEVYGQHKYYATWLPSIRMQLGDIGELDGRWFHRLDNINSITTESARRNFGSTRSPARMDLSYASKGAVQVQGNVAVDGRLPAAPLARGKASLHLTFKRENAVWFGVEDCQIEQVEHQLALREQVKFLMKTRAMGRNMHVVTEVVHASRCTALVSGSAGDVAELTLDGKAPGLVQQDLLRASASATLKSSSAMSLCIVGKQQLTPLFVLMSINADWLQWLGQPEYVLHNELGGQVSGRSGGEPDVLAPVA